MRTWFAVAYNLGIYAVALRYFYYGLGVHLGQIHLKPMPHVKNFVHFFVGRATLRLYQLKKRRRRKQIILYHLYTIIYKVQHFGLPTARAMHQPVYVRAQLRQHLLYNGGVGAGGRKHQFASVQTGGGGLG